MKLKEFIEPTILSNCDMYGDNLGDKKFDTNDYVKTVKYEDEYVEFRQVNSFGNYYFQDVDEIKNDDNNAYVIRKEDLEKYQINQEKFKITEFEKYVVIENK